MKKQFTTRELADMTLPSFPRTPQGWDKLVKLRRWEYTEHAGKGRGGIRREYTPPPEVMALIESYQRGELPQAMEYVARSPVAEYRDSSTILIDYYVDVRGSAGPGAIVPEEAIVKVRFDAKLLRERVGNNFSHIKMAGVSGDSMEPTLSHGDQVLIDTSITHFRDNAIYAIQQDGFLRFKRIKLKLDGSVIVKSDSAPDDVETYTAEEASRFFVIGEVIPFKFGRFKV